MKEIFKKKDLAKIEAKKKVGDFESGYCNPFKTSNATERYNIQI